MQDVYIYDTVRTPRGKGKRDGSLHEVPAVDLLKNLLVALRDRNNLDTSLVDDVLLGCVTPVGEQGADIARTAVLYAGWDQSVAGVQLNRFCGSGLEAVNLATSKIGSGMEDMVVAGGVEAMSRIPMGSDGGAMVMDTAMNEAMGFIPQGVSADLIATLAGYSREQLDAFAAESHRRAAEAQADGRFDGSVVPVKDRAGLTVLEKDETIRPSTSVESLSALKPSFAQMGQMGFDHVAKFKYPEVGEMTHVHHAGNSSGIVDGAGLVLLGSKEAGEKAGLKPRAKIRQIAVTGSEPTIMLTGIAPACRKALDKAGMTVDDIDLVEINEAFAAVVLKATDDLGIPLDKVNVNGGAIAMGHPLGATGAIILGTLVDELERQNKKTGMASLCIGGGMGVATIIERV